VHAKQVLALESGDTVILETAGGGGFGDPLTRPVEDVLGDLLDRKITASAAREEYGVVIEEDRETVDEAATAALRKRLANERGPVTWALDRGLDGRM